jgi:hypothetical protein
MTRKTRVGLAVAAVLFVISAVTAFWLTGGGDKPADDTPSQAHTTPPPPAPPGPIDPQALAEVREAYQKSLAENAPPGMLELMQGSGHPAGDLPPLTDPFVTPARFQPDTPGDLPPLPPELAARPELLPPPTEVPAAGKVTKEDQPGDLPPLPPLPPVKNP